MKPTADQLEAAGIEYTTTPPTSGYYEGYQLADGTIAYIPSYAQNGYMVNAVSDAQLGVLQGRPNGYGPAERGSNYVYNPSLQNQQPMASRPGGPQEVMDGTGQGMPGDTIINSNGDTIGTVDAYGQVRLNDGRVVPQQGPAGPGKAPVYEYANGPGSTGPGTAAQQAAGPAGPSLEQQARDAARDREQRDAYVRLGSVLAEYGLESLAGQIQGWLVDGLSEAEITQRLRDTQEFKARFPAIEARKKAGLPPLSPNEYLAYERQARQTFRQAGLPEGFYDSNDDFTTYLTGDVSLAELTDRIGMASNAAYNADPTVRAELARFGLTGGDVTAFFLDPEVAQPLLERKYNAARLSASANRSGFGSLSEEQATGLAQIGVSEGQAAAGFGQLTEQKELFETLDRGEAVITRDDQIGAQFQGNGNARRRIQQRQRRRQAAFEGGGSFAAGQQGIAGLGDAD